MILTALILDTYRQILSNRVFRILAALSALMVFASFAVQFLPDRVRILWGVWEQTYSPLPIQPDWVRMVIWGIQEVLVVGLAGVTGMFLSVAATASFTPEAMRPGTLHLYLSRPISRTMLLLSHYFGGLLFVLLLALFLLGGTTLGFRTSSGVILPGYLLCALPIVYLFAVLFAFSTLIGVITRSTPASLVATLILWTFSTAMRPIHEGIAKGESFLFDVLRTLEWPEWPVKALGGLYWILPKTSEVLNFQARLFYWGWPEAMAAEQSGGPMRHHMESSADWTAVDMTLSIGTSLAFAASCLALAVWRLHRRDV